MLLRLASLEMGGHLGLIHPDWKGWRIERSNGNLLAPPDLNERPYRPAHLILMPMLHQMRDELDRQRADRPPHRRKHAT
jgi:hypothetical protein